MEIDAQTAASNQQLANRSQAPFELRATAADRQIVLPVHSQPTVLGLGSQSSESRWEAKALESGVSLTRIHGHDTIAFRNTLVEKLQLQAGQSFHLAGQRFWVVDTASPYLGILEGVTENGSWNLAFQDTRLGRKNASRHNEIEINHATVSRVQATFSPADDGEVVLLCETANSPVIVNGERLALNQTRLLNHGDTLIFGELAFRFRSLLGDPARYFPAQGLPARIGAYPVVGRLGSGAMAVVYEGLSSTGQKVAIKVPMPHLVNDPDFVRRFNREMKLGSDLQHPRLTRILFFEPAGSKAYPYLVMEKIEGRSLADFSLPLTVAMALQWTGQLLETLAYLHQAGVIHRDLKPENLFYTDQGLKIADLGIAHFQGTIGERATQTGTVLGTPVYLDPAMLRGCNADPRSDLYSAGLILYEWLAGKLPYPADLMQIFALKLSTDLPPLEQVLPGLAPGIYQLVKGLSSPDPEQRFGNAQIALQAVQQLC